MVAHPFWIVAHTMSKGTDYLTGLVVAYDALRDENDFLRERFASASRRAADRAELWEQNDRLRRMIAFERTEPRLTLQPAEVIGRFEGTLIVDRGAVHGVRELMCAMSADGIVGVVRRVMPFQSYIATLHHPECNVGAVTARGRVYGRVQGTGSDLTHVCEMHYIDLKDDVRPGDRVVTCGGSVFPSGYPIGTVTDVSNRGTLVKAASIQPAADPYRIDEVFLVRKAAEDVDDLAGTEETAPAFVQATDVPEDRPLQERLAP